MQVGGAKPLPVDHGGLEGGRAIVGQPLFNMAAESAQPHLLGLLQLFRVDGFLREWIRPKNLQITLMIIFEFVQIRMLIKSFDLMAVGIILIVYVIGLNVQVFETFLN
jgi:hypothetical protein